MENNGKLAGKTLFITGASRGIGKAIAIKAARDGANIVIAAKTATPHPKLPGTIYTAAEEVENAGGKALACIVDVRNENQVKAAVEAAVEKFGGIDIVINNASALYLSPIEHSDMKRYDLINNINTRGTFLVTKECLPFLQKSKQGHILIMSPPIILRPEFFTNQLAYTISKYGMSMCALGMSAEFKKFNIGVNTLWPQKIVHTAATDMLYGADSYKYARKTDIMADAAYSILTRDPKICTGNFFIDEAVLKEEGITDLTRYACCPENKNHLVDCFSKDPIENVYQAKL